MIPLLRNIRKCEEDEILLPHPSIEKWESLRILDNTNYIQKNQICEAFDFLENLIEEKNDLYKPINVYAFPLIGKIIRSKPFLILNKEFMFEFANNLLEFVCSKKFLECYANGSLDEEFELLCSFLTFNYNIKF